MLSLLTYWLLAQYASPVFSSRLIRRFKIFILCLTGLSLPLILNGIDAIYFYPEIIKRLILFPIVICHLSAPFIFLGLIGCYLILLLAYLLKKMVGLFLGRILPVTPLVNRWLARFSRSAIPIRAGSLLLPLFIVIAVGYLFYQNYGGVQVRPLTLKIPELPEPLQNLKIVHISDLHLGAFTNRAELDRLPETINRLKPDLVVFTGDLLDTEALFETAKRLLGRIQSRYGFYGVPGNHEYYIFYPYLARRLKELPLNFLLDEAREISVQGEKIQLIGLEYAIEQGYFGIPFSSEARHVQKGFQRVMGQKGLKIALVHSPEYFDYLKGMAVPVVLAGHTHGGQFYFGDQNKEQRSLIKRRFRYFKGYYRDKANQLYVNSGLGNWLPLRMNCPREITVITLQKAP